MIVKRIITTLHRSLLSIVTKYRYFLTFLLGSNLLFSPNLFAGLEDLPIGARSLGMGGTYVALANTADAVFLNPGGLGQLIGTEISLFYQKPFGLKELNFGTASVSFPIWRHRFSLGLLSLGNGVYNEQMFTLAYSYHYHQKLFYGVSIRYQTLQIERYGASGTFGLDLGMVMPISSRINWGFLTKNFNRPAIGRANEKLPQSFTTGISAQPTANVILNFEIYKDVRFSQELRFGAEFKPFNNLALRAGTANNPNRFSAGFGVRVWPFTLDYAFFTHTDLGVTHQLSLSFHIGSKQKVEISNVEPVVVKQAKPSTKRKETSKNISHTESLLSAKKINLNTASIAELKSLPGIGESLARAIIDYRNKHGSFETSADLLKVSGIGHKTLEKIKDFILIVQLQ